MCAIRGISFFLNDQCYVVDVDIVERVARKVDVSPVPTALRGVAGIANLKGKVITILSISDIMNHDPHAMRQQRNVNIVVFKAFSDDSDQIGLIADRVGDLIEFDDDKIVPPPLDGEELFYILGVVGTDEVLYRIMNIEAVITRFKNVNEYDADTTRQGGTVNEENV